MNLFQLAGDNTARLQQQVDDLRRVHEGDHDATGRMDRFLEQIRAAGRIGVNMRLFVAASVFRDGAYLNRYEVAAKMAAASGRAPEEVLREGLGDYYEKRLAFDAAFEESRSFYYGALTIGGIGATKYGPVCFVARAEFAAQATRCCYVRADTLNHYIDASNTLRTDALMSDLAAPEHRHTLCLLKHAHALESCAEDWAAMLCSDTEYVEAVFMDKLGPEQAEDVRICKQEKQALQALIARHFIGNLDDTETSNLFDFQSLLAALGRRSVQLTEVSTC
jgi:hypothetical protein